MTVSTLALTPFRKVLIANRGEIALRVMRSARALGLPHGGRVLDAPTPARATCRKPTRRSASANRCPRSRYLSIAAIIEAARHSGADAVHPGYGFLAENEDFAQACRDAGLVFIGPSPEAIAAMGNKAGAKTLMQAAGVPCIPGYQGDDQGEQRLAAEAARIGFPVMIKATAGGGGRGMRLVPSAAEFAELLRSAQLRSAERLRRPGSDPRTCHRRAAPHRDPGLRRPPRPRDPSGRARLLGAAPSPEADRGGAVARGDAPTCASAWARPRSPRSRRSATKARARSNSCSTARATSTSWR